MTRFHKEPYPERIYQIAGFGSNNQMIEGLVLSVGVITVTENGQGLKVIPHDCIGFAVGKEPELESNLIDVPTSMARDLAKRIVEMCDVVDKKSRQRLIQKVVEDSDLLDVIANKN